MKVIVLYALRCAALLLTVLVFAIETILKATVVALVFCWDFKPRHTHILKHFYFINPSLVSFIVYGTL